MAEKKKLTTAEILAALRKTDGKGSGAHAPEVVAPAPEVGTPAADAPAETSSESMQAASAGKAAASKPSSGGRPSVAEMMAMARAGGKGGATSPAAATEKPVAEKAKPAPKPAAKTDASKLAGATSTAKDTASILSTARTSAKPGPITKAEAAAREKPESPAAKKPAEPAPPMPVKPDYAKPKPAKAGAEDDRRGFLSTALGTFLGLGFTSLTATTALWSLGTARFMFPNILTEPPSKFKIGYPSNFPPGYVENKYKAQYGIWVVNVEYQGVQQIYALRSVCTHLGCTPNWLDAEQKFKCPCHGSGFYKDGINFEGPAPRPLERYAIRLADDGQLEVDKSKGFQQELGQWSDAQSFVPV